MERNEVLANLCSYDRRNPNCIDDDSLIEDHNLNLLNGKPCYCDNCHTGRTELANEILKLRLSKRGKKLKPDTWLIIHSPKGFVFWTHKRDKDITALATHYKRKLKTEKQAIVSGTLGNPNIESIIKVTVLDDPIKENDDQPNP